MKSKGTHPVFKYKDSDNVLGNKQIKIVRIPAENKDIKCNQIYCEEEGLDALKCDCGKEYCSFIHFAASGTHPQCGSCLCIHNDGNWSSGPSTQRCATGHRICKKCTDKNTLECKICIGKEMRIRLCHGYKCESPSITTCSCGVKTCNEHFAHVRGPNTCDKCGCSHRNGKTCVYPECNKYICEVCLERSSFCSEGDHHKSHAVPILPRLQSLSLGIKETDDKDV